MDSELLLHGCKNLLASRDGGLELLHVDEDVMHVWRFISVDTMRWRLATSVPLTEGRVDLTSYMLHTMTLSLMVTRFALKLV